jgi:hypothetical protein
MQLIIAKTGANGIPALSGETLGKGLCTPYRIDDATPIPNGADFMAYNLFDESIGPGRWVIVGMTPDVPVAVAAAC